MKMQPISSEIKGESLENLYKILKKGGVARSAGVTGDVEMK